MELLSSDRWAFYSRFRFDVSRALAVVVEPRGYPEAGFPESSLLHQAGMSIKASPIPFDRFLPGGEFFFILRR